MFERIQEKLKTGEGIQSMTGEELYYAEWLNLCDGLSPELLTVFAEECVMNLVR